MLEYPQESRPRRPPPRWLIVLLVLFACAALLYVVGPERTEELPVAILPTGTPSHASVSPSSRPTGGAISTPPSSPTATPSVTSTPEGSSVVTYTVKAGDTLSEVAKAHGVKLENLLAANALEEDAIIQPGQVITIPVGEVGSAPVTPLAPTSESRGEANVITYTVKAGDTLSEVAKANGVALASLLAANRLEEDAVIQPGQELTISVGDARSAPAPSPAPTSQSGEAENVVRYEVKEGDTLSAIAKQFNASLTAIMQANAIEDPELLRVGQELRIPLGPPTLTPTATPAPTATSTPGPPYAAPALLWPPDGANMGDSQYVLMNWAAAGLLEDSSGYLLRLWDDEGNEDVPIRTVWTRGTSWRFDRGICAGGDAMRTFSWEVMAAICSKCAEGDLAADSMPAAMEPLSDESPRRRFTWCGSQE